MSRNTVGGQTASKLDLYRETIMMQSMWSFQVQGGDVAKSSSTAQRSTVHGHNGSRVPMRSVMNRTRASPQKSVTGNQKYVPLGPNSSKGSSVLSGLLPTVKCISESTSANGFDAPRILCYGDSLTAGLAGNFVKTYAPYASRLSQLLNCPVDHVGLCGKTTQDMVNILSHPTATDVKNNTWENAGLQYALNKAHNEGRPYTAVVILAGTNDLATSGPQQIVDNLMRLHNIVRGAGAVSVACAVPKHGAILCDEFKETLPASMRSSISSKVDKVNVLLRQRVAAANEAATSESGDKEAGWIAFVDPHSEVIRAAGSDRASTFAGFPTLAEFNECCNQQSRVRENENVPIHKTASGQQLKNSNPKMYSQLQDPLHFSARGYRSFAEKLVDMCKTHLVRLS